jgi:hypothetical protein
MIVCIIASMLSHLVPLSRTGVKYPNVRQQGRSSAVPQHANVTEIRRRTRLSPQPLQSRKTSRNQADLQTKTHRRSRRVAPTLFRIGSCLLRQTETGSNLSDSTRKVARSSNRPQRKGLYSRCPVFCIEPKLPSAKLLNSFKGSENQ